MIAKVQYQTIAEIYNYYNKMLFNAKLKDCMITISPKKDGDGHFRHSAWKDKATEKDADIHEISLSPEIFDRADIEWHQVLVYLMLFVWQYDYGKPPRKGYHNTEWALKAEKIGLMPSVTGKPGGKKTGQKMPYYPIPGGLFMKAYKCLKEKNIKYSLGLGTKKYRETSKTKEKYTCSCDKNVWGKPNMFIVCGDCLPENLQIQLCSANVFRQVSKEV